MSGVKPVPRKTWIKKGSPPKTVSQPNGAGLAGKKHKPSAASRYTQRIVTKGM